MIFLDESGKRWSRIKRSTAAAIVLTSFPVALLLAGSLAYHPQWGVLPLAKQTAGIIISAVTHAESSKSIPTKTASKPHMPAVKPQSNKPANSQVLGVSAPSKSSAAPTPASSPQSTVSPVPTRTPAETGNPIANDFGQSHKK